MGLRGYDLLDLLLREELRIANRHLPRKRPSLCELASMEVPHVVTSDGGVHLFDPRELSLLLELTGGECSLKLPIIIEYVPNEQGLYFVKDPQEAAVVSRVLGLESRVPLVLHRAHLLELRRRLRTTSTIVLTPGTLPPSGEEE